MLPDDDPRLSPHWIGRRAPFNAFQTAIGHFTGAYDIRDGLSDDPMSRIELSLNDWYGQPITVPRLISVAAFDDLLLTVQQLSSRHQADLHSTGWMLQCNADRRMAVRDRWAAKGTDMAAFRAKLREDYAESARRNPQPPLCEDANPSPSNHQEK